MRCHFDKPLSLPLNRTLHLSIDLLPQEGVLCVQFSLIENKESWNKLREWLIVFVIINIKTIIPEA